MSARVVSLYTRVYTLHNAYESPRTASALKSSTDHVHTVVRQKRHPVLSAPLLAYSIAWDRLSPVSVTRLSVHSPGSSTLTENWRTLSAHFMSPSSVYFSTAQTQLVVGRLSMCVWEP